MDVNPTGNRKAERAEATRRALLDSARRLFAERGYAGVGTEEIVRASGVTRGALYHHFAGKKELFRAVYEDVERELLAAVAARAEAEPGDPLTVLRRGVEAFLDACEEPAVQRIALVDAPSVLGWAQWREIGMRHGLGLVQDVLDAAVADGQIAPGSTRTLAHLLLGALDEGALLVARANDEGRTRREVAAVLARQIDGLRSTT
jgi:AcrR family transcriptional regulator